MRRGGVRPEPRELGTQLLRRDELADREILHPFVRPGGERFGHDQLAGEDEGAVVAEHQGRLGEGWRCASRSLVRASGVAGTLARISVATRIRTTSLMGRRSRRAGSR